MKSYSTQLLEDIIQKEPRFRETKNKHKAVTYILRNTIPELQTLMTPTELENIVQKAISLDREWRDLTKEYNTDEKKKLSEQWKKEHGYNPLHYQDVKQLKLYAERD